MIAWLRTQWARFRNARKLSAESDPTAIAALAEEVGRMAELAFRVGPREKKLLERLRILREEMDRMAELARRPEFHRLPRERRILLRQGLLKSRQQILDGMTSAPTPTRIVQ